MDIQDQYQVCDKHRYSVVISIYSALTSDVLILTCSDILDSKAEYSNIRVQHLLVTIRSHG